MIDLQNRNELDRIDTRQALTSIEQLPLQLSLAWQEVGKLVLPDDYTDIRSIVVCGMGASWLGGHILQFLLKEALKIPLVVCHDYSLPGFVDEHTLLIAYSYSGTTEETLENLTLARERRAKIIAIATGGTLISMAQKANLPYWQFSGVENPAKSSRLAQGYALGALLRIFQRLKLIGFDEAEIAQGLAHLKTRLDMLRPEAKDNEAMLMAQSLIGYMPIIVSGSFLLGVAHTFSNQVNETAKTFGTYMHIPELNHHNLEGLGHPSEVNKLKYVFINSNFYDPRVIRRIKVTQSVIAGNKVGFENYQAQGATKFIQTLDVLLFGSFVTYYMAMLYGLDPTPNPWVDYFKAELAKETT